MARLINFAREILSLSKHSLTRASTALIALLMRAKGLQIRLTVLDISESNGGGAQLHARMAGWALANQIKAEYFHSPMELVDHGGADTKDWVDKWNYVFDFESAVKCRTDSLNLRETKISGLLKIALLSKIRATISVRISNPTAFTDACPQALDVLRPEIRRILRNPGVIRAEAETTCAHFRAYQPRDVGFTSARQSNLETLIEAVGRLNEMKENSHATIFVSPDSDMTQVVLPSNTKFDTCDALEALYRMAQSGELIIAKSSLSFVAGLACSGRVYYEKFWHSPMSDWRRFEAILAEKP